MRVEVPRVRSDKGAEAVRRDVRLLHAMAAERGGEGADDVVDAARLAAEAQRHMTHLCS